MQRLARLLKSIARVERPPASPVDRLIAAMEHELRDLRRADWPAHPSEGEALVAARIQQTIAEGLRLIREARALTREPGPELPTR